MSAEYVEDGKRIHVFGPMPSITGSLKAMKALVPLRWEGARRRRSRARFLHLEPRAAAAAETGAAADLRSSSTRAGFPRRLKQVVVSVSGAGRDPGIAGMQCFTYEP